MEKSSEKIRSFTDLRAWKESHLLALDIYKSTESFPDTERYGLSSQIHRAAVSVPSNIAEGFGRQTAKDQIHFLYVALGSVNETQSQLLLAKDLGFLSNDEFLKIAKRTVAISKMINGLIKSLKTRKVLAT